MVAAIRAAVCAAPVAGSDRVDVGDRIGHFR